MSTPIEHVGRGFRKGAVVLPSARFTVTTSAGSLAAVESLPATSYIKGQDVTGGRLMSPSPPPRELVGQQIELELEDGLRWSCSIADHNGTLVNSGGIK